MKANAAQTKAQATTTPQAGAANDAPNNTPTPENTPLPGGGSWRWDPVQACWADAAAPAAIPSVPTSE